MIGVELHWWISNKMSRYIHITPQSTPTATYAAIQNALGTGDSVCLDPGVFDINYWPMYRAPGQMIVGAGRGDSSGAAITKVNYVGPAGGKILTLYDGVQHYSHCSLENVLLNGNGLANVGIMGHDDISAVGCANFSARNVTIIGVNYGVNPTNVYLGVLRPEVGAFAHNFNFHNFHMYGGGYGFWGKGEPHTLSGGCTIQGQVLAGVRAEVGARLSLGDTTFSANGWDIDAYNAQQISAFGAWFEESTQGVYRAQTAHSVDLLASLFHTNNAAYIMELGSSAGRHNFSGRVADSTHSSLIINVNPSATGRIDTIGTYPLRATYAVSGDPVPMQVLNT